ncbi:hypothetical protein HUS23_07405 [Ectothiorhodospiraceae bacterium 2226]|nr:hypothetical protein HUS23_07405 [Ectothiorhodospiraceae bacterium 2226]
MPLLTDLARRQLTRLELALVAMVFGALVYGGHQRLDALGAQAEEVALQVTINNLRTALLVEALVAHAQGDIARIPALAGSDPMQLMQTGPRHPLLGPAEPGAPPRRHLGTLHDADPAAVDGGLWYFDGDRRELVYRVRHAHYFESEAEGPARVRLRVEVADGEGVHGVRLRTLDAYRWNL